MGIKFDIMSRLSKEVVFTAEIEADEGANYGVKLGLAVKAAVKAGVCLDGANLAYADLAGAILHGARLSNVDLTDAQLYGANLAYANLAYANLTYATLKDANLKSAWLNVAKLTYINLDGADLKGACLNGAHGINYWIKCLQIENWPINYTSEVMQIGCKQHSFEEWRNFSDTEICAMDGQALSFWTKWRETIFKIVEMAPAKPTK